MIYKEQFPNVMGIYGKFKGWKKDTGLSKAFSGLDEKITSKKAEMHKYLVDTCEEIEKAITCAEIKIRNVESKSFFKKDWRDALFSSTQRKCRKEIEYCRQMQNELNSIRTGFMACYGNISAGQS